jgi:hypothetical protein
MNNRQFKDDYLKEVEEDMSSFNYSKKYSKFMVRETKLQKRKNKAEDWYD